MRGTIAHEWARGCNDPKLVIPQLFAALEGKLRGGICFFF
jgi:hypothetical protein